MRFTEWCWNWMKVGIEMLIYAPYTFAPRILCTGSESSKTTNPKLGSFPPTPLVFIRSSTTFPYAATLTKIKFNDVFRLSIQIDTFMINWIIKLFALKMPGFLGKHTHEELFEFALIDVMWEVANKKLVAVWVPDYTPAVHFTRLSIPPATCR